MGFLSLIGKEQINYTDVSKALLDSVYSDNAIILNDSLEILMQKYTPIKIPLPLVGFQYRPTGTIGLLNYTWNEYTYLNRENLTNACIKNTSEITLTIYDVITSSYEKYNSVFTAVEKRTALKELLEVYTSAGGTFTINTLWGTIPNCVLENLSGVENETMQGTEFVATFRVLNIVKNQIDKATSKLMQALSNGGVY